MLENRSDADRMENDIFQALDVGVLVRKKADADGMRRRYIDQLCFYVRDKGVNRVEMVVFDGKCVTRELSDSVIQLFERSGIRDPFVNPLLEQMLGGGV